MDYKGGSSGALHGFANGMHTRRELEQKVVEMQQKALENWLEEVIEKQRHLCVCEIHWWGVVVTTMGRAVTKQWTETTSIRLMYHEFDSLEFEDAPTEGTPIEVTPNGKWRKWVKVI